MFKTIGGTMITEKFAKHKKQQTTQDTPQETILNIQYLDNEGNKNQDCPLIIIPGLTENTEDYRSFLEEMQDDRCIVLSLRARGKSSAPEKGYTLEDHIADIEAVVSDLSLNNYRLFGYSRGASYALGFALKYPENVKALIIGDYPAIHSRLPETWVDMFVKLPPWHGLSTLERMSLSSLNMLQKDSKEVIFYDALKSLEIPMMIFKGELKSSALSEEMLSRYVDAVPLVNIIRISDTGHDIFTPNMQRIVKEVIRFCEVID